MSRFVARRGTLDTMLEVRVDGSVLGLPAEAWDALVGDGSPFVEHAWLATLEEAGCVGGKTGWAPRPVTVWRRGTLVGAAPAYLRADSFGDYVYDWSVARWAAQRGLRWYPKLVVAVPFTPVTGARLLVAPGEDADAVREALVTGLARAAEGTSGVHVHFATEDEGRFLVARGAAERLQAQYHWHDRGYGDFEGFLATLPAKRRSETRRERRKVSGFRVEAARGAPDPEVAWRFYADTYRRHTGGPGYLNRAFFDATCARWAHRLHTVRAWDGDELVAGTFNVVKGDRLHGRWWGCAREVPYLHFEVAIHAAVEWCLREGVTTFEPGHGGEHKRARGFDPVIVRSFHLHADGAVHAAVADAYAREAEAVRAALAGDQGEGG